MRVVKHLSTLLFKGKKTHHHQQKTNITNSSLMKALYHNFHFWTKASKASSCVSVEEEFCYIRGEEQAKPTTSTSCSSQLHSICVAKPAFSWKSQQTSEKLAKVDPHVHQLRKSYFPSQKSAPFPNVTWKRMSTGPQNTGIK